jgi:hypothetical protein
MKIYMLTIFGEVDEVVYNEDLDFWVDKSGKHDVYFDTKDGDPDIGDYVWLKLYYSMRDLEHAIDTLNWVKTYFKQTNVWVEDHGS